MIQTGDIIVVHHYFNLLDVRTWLSWLIRKKTKCPFNHCEIIQLEEKTREIEIVGALSKGFVGRHYSVWIKERPMHYLIMRSKKPFSDDQLAMLIRYKGRNYDFWSTFVWHLIHWITGKWYGPTGVAALEKPNCSEVIGDIWGLDNSHMVTTADVINSGMFEFTNERL